MEPDPQAATLSRIARAVAETLELKEAFVRVAEAAAAVLPLDTMTVLRREGPETFMRYSSTGVTPEPPHTIRLGDFSPAIRPSTDGIRRLEDMAGALDPAFFVDGKIQREGLRSGLIVPLRRGEQVSGFVFVGSRRPGAFTAEHEKAVQPIADLLGLALEHERLWSLDAARRR